jgi:hypothetical protein
MARELTRVVAADPATPARLKMAALVEAERLAADMARIPLAPGYLARAERRMDAWFKAIGRRLAKRELLRKAFP